MKTFKEHVESIGLSAILGYLDTNPDKNLPKILNWVEKLDKEGMYAGAYSMMKNVLSDEKSCWNIFLKSLYADIDTGVRKKLFENFLVNAAILGNSKRMEKSREYGCNVPWAILMDPTSACNLHCTGCWAAEYGNSMSMNIETLDKIITEGKDLGVYMYLYSGGEPMVRKDDIIKLCERHDDCVFMAFTNATLIDEKFAEDMLRVKNFVPAISVEGFEEETDMRRGHGTYNHVVKAMDLLKSRKLPFGFSTCYHSKNTDVVGSERYIDEMIAKGCKFGWYFTYIPVGNDSPTELLATAPQREFMYHQIRKFRSNKPLFTMDFWNDGEFVGGCIAGGRCYLHINANGDIEPCAFIHYSDTNIKDHTLLDALKRPLFMAYHNNQPFSANMLRPCPLLDNNGRLADMVHESGAHSTDFISPEDVDELCGKCKKAAASWKPVADQLWQCSGKCNAFSAENE